MTHRDIVEGLGEDGDEDALGVAETTGLRIGVGSRLDLCEIHNFGEHESGLGA